MEDFNKKDLDIQEGIKRIVSDAPEYPLPENRIAQIMDSLPSIARERPITVKRRLPFFEVNLFAVPRLALVTISVLCVIGLAYILAPRYPIVANISGTVKIYRFAKNEWVFASQKNEKLYRGDMIKTFGDGQADVMIPRTYHMRVKNDSEMKLVQAPSILGGRSIKYDLERGKVFVSYEKALIRKRKFDIDTLNAKVSVIGTQFMVNSNPQFQKTWVGVLNGLVQVTGKNLHPDIAKLNSARVYVEPGKKTVVRTGKTPAVPKRLMENELFELEELYRIGHRPQVALLISSGKTRTRELLSLTPIYISADKPGILPEHIVKIVRQFSQAIKEKKHELYIQNIKMIENVVNNYPNDKYNVQFLLFIGAYYHHLGEHNKSIATFKRIVRDYQRSRLVSIAQCAIGIIYEEDLKDYAKAKRVYENIISDYPASAEVDEARAGLIRLSQ